jgi:hypothetical protein
MPAQVVPGTAEGLGEHRGEEQRSGGDAAPQQSSGRRHRSFLPGGGTTAVPFRRDVEAGGRIRTCPYR